MFSWLFPHRRSLEHLEVKMLTRAGCHLCEEAWQILETARAQHGFRLVAVDVDADPELVKEHGECVPVVLVDGKVRFRGRVNSVLLARLLRAATRKV